MTALRCPGGCVSIRAVSASPAGCLPRSLRSVPFCAVPARRDALPASSPQIPAGRAVTASAEPAGSPGVKELDLPGRLHPEVIPQSCPAEQREQNGAQREELSSDHGLCKSSQLHSNEFITRSFSTKFSLKTVISACGITQCNHPECLTLFQKAFFSPGDKKLRLGSELTVERLLCLSPWIRGFIIPNYGIISGHAATASDLSSSACFTF